VRVDDRDLDLTLLGIDSADHEQELIERLRAEAARLGINPRDATDAEIGQLALLLPVRLRTDLMNAAREHGWNPIEFVGFSIRPMLTDVHDCEECAARAARTRRPR
jgi:hypothetical protein